MSKKKRKGFKSKILIIIVDFILFPFLVENRIYINFISSYCLKYFRAICMFSVNGKLSFEKNTERYNCVFNIILKCSCHIIVIFKLAVVDFNMT